MTFDVGLQLPASVSVSVSSFCFPLIPACSRILTCELQQIIEVTCFYNNLFSFHFYWEVHWLDEENKLAIVSEECKVGRLIFCGMNIAKGIFLILVQDQ